MYLTKITLNSIAYKIAHSSYVNKSRFLIYTELITCFHEFWHYEFFSTKYYCFVCLRSIRFQLRSKPTKNTDITGFFNKKKNFASFWKNLRKKFVVSEFVKKCDELVISCFHLITYKQLAGLREFLNF